MKSLKSYINAVTTLLPLSPTGFVVRYGRSNGHDIDLFAVTHTDMGLVWNVYPLDLYAIGWNECERLVELLDPRVTEPCLTGSFVAGNREAFDRMRRLLEQCRPTTSVISYLMQQGAEQILSARRWLSEYKLTGDCSCARGCLMSLAYSCSYWIIAGSYARGQHRILRFDDCLRQSSYLTGVRSKLDEVKSGSLPDPESLYYLISEWETQLAVNLPLSLDGECVLDNASSNNSAAVYLSS